MDDEYIYKNCGNCKYHEYDREVLDEWVCVNESSDAFGIETCYTDTCVDWEKRNG